jgi:hypothetical protein
MHSANPIARPSVAWRGKGLVRILLLLAVAAMVAAVLRLSA